MKFDLPYVCEFCHAPTRKISRMDVSDDTMGEDEPKTQALMFVCATCKDLIVDLATELAQTDDPDVHMDFVAGTLHTSSEELRTMWEALRARRRRW
jgi:hypothetical protein